MSFTVGQKVTWRGRPAKVLEVNRFQARIEYQDPRGSRHGSTRKKKVAISELKVTG